LIAATIVVMDIENELCLLSQTIRIVEAHNNGASRLLTERSLDEAGFVAEPSFDQTARIKQCGNCALRIIAMERPSSKLDDWLIIYDLSLSKPPVCSAEAICAIPEQIAEM
jgi:hypothetical protein